MMADSTFRSQPSRRLDRWHLLLLIFAITYACVLAINLAYSSMEWDEVTHFTGGLLWSRGQVGQWVWTNSFYPPAFDMVTAVYYLVGGASVFAARLVSVTFAALSIAVVYEIGRTLYNSKTGLIAAVFLAAMPGFVWLSRMAMIETMLIFIFSFSMLFFFKWIRTSRERDRILAVVALGVGVAVKYQMLVVVPLIMLLGMFFWKRDYLKKTLASYLKFPRLIVILAVVAAVGLIAYGLYATGLMDVLLYAIRTGTAERAIYSTRYPTPVFYFFEMTWVNDIVHPVSPLLYIVGLAGLGYLGFRRKVEDKFLLLWFIVVYAVFTVISNREWRYVTIVFPVLAIAASNLLMQVFEKTRSFSLTLRQGFLRKWTPRLVAGLLVAFSVVALIFSGYDANALVARDQLSLPTEQATAYAANGIAPNQRLMVACPLNRFTAQMVWFYLNAKAPDVNQNRTLQYPVQAVDAYTPDFNITQLSYLCQQYNVKSVMLFEYGGTTPYFNTTLTATDVFNELHASSQFTLASTFGTVPNRIFVFSFTPQPT